MFEIDPIGTFHSKQKEKYEVPRQPGIAANDGLIRLLPHRGFEQALEGLEGFERIWVIFRFHQNTHWKPKVLPPRGDVKQGVFATRSPHRPNFLGLSCVELLSVNGLDLHIANHDLMDGTPILDIKPYINYADSFQCKRQGWLENLDIHYSIEWSPIAQQQIDDLFNWGVDLKGLVEMRLATNPLPSSNNRIREIASNSYELACKTWRIYYRLDPLKILITHLDSGYDAATLRGEKTSRWDDLPIHQEYKKKWQ
jgi:tRNA-Thr(GGU) m(6)t(6)A37 methyltransferase TsaA